jgi:aminoglycoside/choline kinase family phosphotransferase
MNPLPASSDPRRDALLSWLKDKCNMPLLSLEPASSDASFRRYFRATTEERDWIAMDAPPEHEDVGPFLHVARLLAGAGVHAPHVHALNLEQGFLLLDDFGNTRYLDALDATSADALYGDALDTLLRIQSGISPRESALPSYDAALLHREMELFRDWFLQKLLALAPDTATHALMDELWQTLIDSALAQPRVCVHRDYHSRNLMVTEAPNPGVLDFQDSVVGPITYDLASLLRDCYIAWPRERVESWALQHAGQLRSTGLLDEVDDALFLRWFDLMGIQRHLKAIGIFSRLWLRDRKPGYLADIPRTLDYVVSVGRRHAECRPFVDFIERAVLPLLDDALNSAIA